MTSDSTSPRLRVVDTDFREPEPRAGATAPRRRIVVHPLAVLGWPAVALPAYGLPRPLRRPDPRRRERKR